MRILLESFPLRALPVPLRTGLPPWVTPSLILNEIVPAHAVEAIYETGENGETGVIGETRVIGVREVSEEKWRVGDTTLQRAVTQ